MTWTVEELKTMARQANAACDWKALQEIIELLDDVWTDDAAALAFYTELEQADEERQ